MKSLALLASNLFGRSFPEPEPPKTGKLFQIKNLEQFTSAIYWARLKNSRSPQESSLAITTANFSSKNFILSFAERREFIERAYEEISPPLLLSPDHLLSFAGMDQDGRPSFQIVGEASKDIIISIDAGEDYSFKNCGLKEYISPIDVILHPATLGR